MVLKRISLIIILCFLGSFYLQKKTKFFTIKPLEGIKELAQKPELKIRAVFDGSYQEAYTKYISENMGFRPWLIKYFNKINFSLFHTTKAPGVVVGKNGHLFIESYINNYIGKNFVGKNRADEITRKIKAVQDALKQNGTDLIVVFAPGKASYYENYIPENYLSRKKDSSNYSYYSKKFPESGVNFIDLNNYFIENKNSFSYPIYPEFGTHWTSYGSAIAMDSIIHYIEAKRNIDLPGFDYSNVILEDSLHEREYDIGILLNLPRILPHKPMPYPSFKYNYAGNKTKPDVLVVGDSYWWCMVGDDIPFHVFKDDEYWFYNRDIYKHNVKQEKGADAVNFANETVNRDVIILMATEATFDLFPYGFIDKAYNIYCLTPGQKRELILSNINSDETWKKSIANKAKENKISENEQLMKDVDFIIETEYTAIRRSFSSSNPVIKEYVEKIKRDGAWMEQIKKKAAENNISVEEQVNKDARFMYDSEYGNPEVQLALKDIKRRISSTPEWMEQIKIKAKEKNISVEEMMDLDARFVYDTEEKNKKK